MSLNIKNEETCRLAEELADLMGETKTGAITLALRQCLERQRSESGAGAQARLERMRVIARRIAALPDAGPPLAEGEELSITHGDYLYDADGLPK